MAEKRNGAMLENLPVEMQTEILSRLDSKTLTRFRCVSKHFSSIVSSREFISAHRLRSSQNPLLIFLIPSYESPDSDEPHHQRLASFNTATNTASSSNISQRNREFPFRYPTTILSCFELICVGDEENDMVYVLNPTNNYRKVLPAKVSFRDSPMDSVGIGYVSSVDQYKLVRITNVSDGKPHFSDVKTYVCTLGMDMNWRQIEQNPHVVIHDFPVAVNHFLYYLTDLDVSTADVNNIVISKFDLEREEWSVLPCLPFLIHSDYWEVKEFRGCLCLVGTKPHVDVWVLQNPDTYSWVKEYHIDMATLVRYNLKYVLYAYPCNIEKDGRLLIWYGDEEEPKLMYHDPGSNSFEIIDLREKLLYGCNDLPYSPPTFYVDSLLSLEEQS